MSVDTWLNMLIDDLNASSQSEDLREEQAFAMQWIQDKRRFDACRLAKVIVLVTPFVRYFIPTEDVDFEDCTDNEVCDDSEACEDQ